MVWWLESRGVMQDATLIQLDHPIVLIYGKVNLRVFVVYRRRPKHMIVSLRPLHIKMPGSS